MEERALKLTMAAETFWNIKFAYVSCRRHQQAIIVDYLKETFGEEKGFKVTSSQGAPTYKGGIPNGGMINWKWIELRKNGMYYFISLQPFDNDPNSGNYHVIYDRIGIFSCEVAKKEYLEGMWEEDKTKKEGKKRFNKFLASSMKLTDIALPIDSEETLKKLADLLR